MAHLDRASLAREPPGHVHQAAEVAGEQRSGPGARHGGSLVLDHGGRDVGIFDAERAAEAAAHLRVRHFGEREALHLRQQGARLVLHAEFAQPRAAVVIDGRHRPAGPHVLEAADIDEEGGQLPHPLAEALVLAPQQVGIVAAQHAGAGARGDDDPLIAAKGAHRPARNAGRMFPVAAVVGRLAAAGLGRRRFHPASRRLQQARGSKRDRGPHQIGQAGREQGYGPGRLAGLGRHRVNSPSGRLTAF